MVCLLGLCLRHLVSIQSVCQTALIDKQCIELNTLNHHPMGGQPFATSEWAIIVAFYVLILEL